MWLSTIIPEAIPEEGLPFMLLWGGFSLLVAATVGFFAGISYAQMQQKRVFHRARNSLQQLYDAVAKSLEHAAEGCRLLEAHPTVVTEPQSRGLESHRKGLVTTLDHILDRYREAIAPKAEPVTLYPGQTGSPYQWRCDPEDRIAGVPDQETCVPNLEILLRWSQQHHRESGLLLVRVDKFDALKERYGIAPAHTLQKRFIGLICRLLREQDLVCRFNGDTFAILLPGIPRAEGERLASNLRNAICQARFRGVDDGPEVLLTASLGYTLCQESARPDEVLSRAEEALGRSQRLGRNQLHLHDGAALLHCA